MQESYLTGSQAYHAATLVISPHLDDAVLSCGHFLLSQTDLVVATVLAGHPGDGRLSEWDRGCGFVAGDDPVARRRSEDRAALAVVGATARHLDFLDRPYRDGRAPEAGGEIRAEDIAAQLAELVRELAPARVLIPMGVLHPDHELTHEAGALLLRSSPEVELWVYKDLPYGLAHPHLVGSRLERLRGRGLRVQPVDVATAAGAERKREATACYASQVDAVRDDLGRDAWERTFSLGSEEFWQLTAP
jgi:LmbE family N-acetylglucosaminyl deacetylase